MFDAHCHLEKRGTCEESMACLYAEAIAAGVSGVVLLNLPKLAYPNEEVIEAAAGYGGFFRVFPGVNPTEPGAVGQVESAGASIKGIKLHPRLDSYGFTDLRCARVVKAAGERELPVMIDCFPDGKNLLLGNTVESMGRLAQSAPKTRLAMGHAGGHHALDAMMMTKHLDNLFLDLSFSLLYYRENARCMEDMKHAIRNARGKIMWGTDHPDRPYGKTVEMSREILERMELEGEVEELFFTGAAGRFLGEK